MAINDKQHLIVDVQRYLSILKVKKENLTEIFKIPDISVFN